VCDVKLKPCYVHVIMARHVLGCGWRIQPPDMEGSTHQQLIRDGPPT